MKPEELAAIKERCEKATAGPWYGYEERESSAEGHAVSTGPSNLFTIGISKQDANDAEFVAHSRTDIPALVAEVERLHAAVKTFRQAMEYADVDESLARVFLYAALDEAEGGAS